MVSRELVPFPVGRWAGSPAAGLSKSTRSRRAKVLQTLHVDEWTRGVMNSVNYLHGVKESPDHLQLSAGQLDSIKRIRSDLESLGVPDTTPVAALEELCSSAPGYAFTPVKTMPYAEGRVALPPPGDKCDASSILTGHARDLWHG